MDEDSSFSGKKKKGDSGKITRDQSPTLSSMRFGHDQEDEFVFRM